MALLQYVTTGQYKSPPPPPLPINHPCTLISFWGLKSEKSTTMWCFFFSFFFIIIFFHIDRWVFMYFYYFFHLALFFPIARPRGIRIVIFLYTYMSYSMYNTIMWKNVWGLSPFSIFFVELHLKNVCFWFSLFL